MHRAILRTPDLADVLQRGVRVRGRAAARQRGGQPGRHVPLQPGHRQDLPREKPRRSTVFSMLLGFRVLEPLQHLLLASIVNSNGECDDWRELLCLLCKQKQKFKLLSYPHGSKGDVRGFPLVQNGDKAGN